MADYVGHGIWLAGAGDRIGVPAPTPSLCVLECSSGDTPFERGGETHIRILFDDPHMFGGTRITARTPQLERAARFIDETHAAGVLVHCGAGIERSPLTVAYWMVTRGREPSWEAAYRKLMSIRPIVQDRRPWLEPMLLSL